MAQKLKGFTLIEMLIVIVIIGLLASSLIPKIAGMQSKARDTTRRTDIGQLAAGIQSYYAYQGTYPGGGSGQSVDKMSADLEDYLTSIPQDAQKTRTFKGIAVNTPQTPGQYLYTTIQRGGIDQASFALMAGIEEPGNNVTRVYSASDGGSSEVPGVDSNGEITTTTDFKDLQKYMCLVVNKGTANKLNTGSDATLKCKAKPKIDNLRYLYIQ